MNKYSTKIKAFLASALIICSLGLSSCANYGGCGCAGGCSSQSCSK